MPDILFEKRDQVALITLNRPEKMNALTHEMQVYLRELWAELRDDDSLRVAIITGNGRAFCSGRDLTSRGPGSPEYLRADLEAGGSGVRPQIPGPLPTEVWKPVIAAVNGHCVAGGYALAMMCDIRIASERANFGMPAVRRSLFSGQGQALRTLSYAPFGRALEMMLVGEAVDAQAAYSLGIANKVVPHEDLLAASFEMAEKICNNAPLSVAAHKEFAYRSRGMSFAEASALENEMYQRMIESDDSLEGSRAFAEKRKADFKGR
jgi:E-phenylitaconyl-CoA hydratase